MFTLEQKLSLTFIRSVRVYQHLPCRSKNDKSYTSREVEQSINRALYGPKRDGSSEEIENIVKKETGTVSKKIWNIENQELYGTVNRKRYRYKQVNLAKKSQQNVINSSKKIPEFLPGDKPKDQPGIINGLFSFPLFSQNVQDSYSLSLPDITVEYDPKAIYNWYTPSVSTILEKSRPPESQILLDKWKERMIEELGEEGFAQYQQELFSKGSNFHSSIQQHLEGTAEADLDIMEANKGHWHSLQTVFPNLGDVTAIECKVKHPTLNYLGYFDCVALYKGNLCIIDWKTSKKPKPTIQSTWDNPLQVTAYLGAFNYDQKYNNTQVENAAIVVAYEDGSPAHIHMLSRDKCVFYWGQWLKRLHTYYTGASKALQQHEAET